jgi:hypothetical protein
MTVIFFIVVPSANAARAANSNNSTLIKRLNLMPSPFLIVRIGVDSITCRKGFPFVGADKIASSHRCTETARDPLIRGMAFASQMCIIKQLKISIVDICLHDTANAAAFRIMLLLGIFLKLNRQTDIKYEPR